MKKMHLIYFICLFLAPISSCAQTTEKKVENMKYNELTPEERYIIEQKGTERPFTGEYNDHTHDGTYICRKCNAPLYKSTSKFDGHCGWPSFDDEIEGAVTRHADADGRRTEIVCANCGGHLGHVFLGEGYTEKNTRHCVNSLSMKFIPAEKEVQKAYFASGCFWGTEYYFAKAKGVKSTTVGFMGGHVDNPTYQQVCTQQTGHFELTEVDYSVLETSYEEMVKLFFETHDFTQTNGQGPDIGPQYLSCIFYSSQKEKDIAEKYIKILESKGYKVATMLKPVEIFWEAEDYHQQYYEHKGSTPYCHSYTKIF